MENDGKNLVEELMLFVEHFDEKNSKMEKDTFQQLAKLLMIHVELQSEHSSTIKRLESMETDVKKILEDSSIGDESKIGLLMDFIKSPNDKQTLNRVSSIKSSRDELENEIMNLNETINTMKTNMKGLFNKNQELEVKFAQSENTMIDLEKQLQEQTEENIIQEGLRKDDQAKFKEKENNLIEEIHELKIKKEEVEDYINKLKEEYELRIKNQKDKIDDLMRLNVQADEKINNLESKLFAVNSELSKKTEKLNQVSVNMAILHNQIELMRKQMEQEKSSFEKEMSNMSSLLEEKNIQITKLLEQKDNKEYDEEDTDYEDYNPFNEVFISNDQINGLIESSNPSDTEEFMRSRHQSVFRMQKVHPAKARSRRSSVAPDQPHVIIANPVPVHKQTQTDGEEKLITKETVIEKLDFKSECDISTSYIDLLKKDIVEKDKQIGYLQEKLMNITIEHTEELNDVTSEYQSVLKKYRKKK